MSCQTLLLDYVISDSFKDVMLHSLVGMSDSFLECHVGFSFYMSCRVLFLHVMSGLFLHVMSGSLDRVSVYLRYIVIFLNFIDLGI